MKIQLLFLLPICASLFAASACVTQKAASTVAPPNAEQSFGTAAAPEIETAQKIIKTAPDSPQGYNQLAAAYIRLSRENGDFSLNANAEAAVSRALEIEPSNYAARRLKTSLHLAFHRFDEAVAAANELQKINPRDNFNFGVLTDAHVELGNYEEAARAAQTMVDLRPDTSSYARVSQIRWLYGDAAGAIEAMRTAAKIADPNDREARTWCVAQLGDLHFKTGKFAAAEKLYDAALEILPAYHLALAGKGRARAAQKDFAGAIKFLTDAQTRVPATETVISLGEAYAKTGDDAKAAQQWKLVEVIEQKLGTAGDQRRLAVFWAERGENLDAALKIARAEYALRKDIYTADALAWCLYKTGDVAAAQKIIGEAMRLKTQDARIFYHAGMIEKAAGNNRAAAAFVQKSLAVNPAFDLLAADTARTALAELKQ